MAQPGKRPTLDFSSGHDLIVRSHEIEPHLRLRAELGAFLVSLLSLSLPLSLSLSLNK